jgi:hypothetical protein
MPSAISSAGYVELDVYYDANGTVTSDPHTCDAGGTSTTGNAAPSENCCLIDTQSLVDSSVFKDDTTVYLKVRSTRPPPAVNGNVYYTVDGHL